MISGPSLAVNVGGYVVALVITASVFPSQLGIGPEGIEVVR